MKQKELLKDLAERTQLFISQAESFKHMAIDQINWRENSEKWSVLQCLEHLNLYGDFYLPEFEKRILSAKRIDHSKLHKGGWFAERTANSMLPQKDKLNNKMKTFKDKNPNHSTLSITMIDRFIKQQQKMLLLLEQAHHIDMNKVKCSLTLPVLKFNLGSTFKFVIYHNERHMWQAKNVLKAQKLVLSEAI